MMKPRKITTVYANPELVRELERQLSEASAKAQSIGALVCQGRATQAEKESAFAEAAAAAAALKEEQKNTVAA